MKRFPEVKWDFIIIDEAHNLRNVFHGTKRAKNLYELSKGIPKILLTATPLQNSLTDLHGLVSFIDQRIFGSEKVFNKRYIEGQDYSDLKRELSPVLYRTLRKDVAKYMNFKKRTCKTVDFTLSQDEIELYQRVNDFLKRELLYSIPTSNLMRDAFQEALVCTNDPECMSNLPAGKNSNGAACHSCCMISETACENGNRMLDRGLVVPIPEREECSYFKELVSELCQVEI